MTAIDTKMMNLVLVVVLVVIAKVPCFQMDVDDEISGEYAILIPSFPKSVFNHACN